MSSFDPMAAAVDWLDAYRAAALSIVDMYAPDAAVECGCQGPPKVVGRDAITEYWQRRFAEKPAGELVGLQMADDGVVVSYAVPDGIVQAILRFNDAGQIVHVRCGPLGASQSGNEEGPRGRT